MKYTIPAVALAAALAVPVSAQDSTVKSRTKIKADEAHIMSMTGCLREDPLTHSYTLIGTMASAGDELKSKTKVKTDIDKDDTKVKATTKTSADDGAVATAGSMTTFNIRPSDEVTLSQHVGHRVQISAVMVDPGHKDADVKIEDKTKIDPEHGDDATARGKAKVEVPRSAFGEYTVVSVKSLGTTCAY
jgi:hypothetical protein